MVIATSCIGAADVRPIPTAGRSAVAARNGMVAASQPLASQAGLRILQKGGNAVDAAIATAATLALVAPMMTGPGGDMFALVYMAETGQLAGLNGSGFSPAAANVDFFKRRELEHIPAKGPFSVTVPGAVDGWITLLERFGTMSLEQVLEPAIQYAEQGFPVSEIFAENWASNSSSHKDDPEFVKAYYTDGKPPKHGDVFVNKPLAWTYRQIARGGRDAFYKGEIARRIVERLNSLDWPMTEEDLAYQHSDWVEPISTTYKESRIYELPPNGQGIAVLQILRILEGFDLQAMGHNSAEYLHVLAEAKKLAFADRARHYADPDFADIPLERLLSADYAAEQRSRIDRARAMERVATGSLEHGDTVYLTVADANGNMVSLIQSNFLEFGSGMTPDGLGFALQSRGSQFSLDPDHPNAYAPGKRPFHTIIPGFVLRDGRPLLAFGVMGGPFQPQGQVQVLLNMIEFGMNVQEAGDAARFSHSSALQPTGGTMTDGGRLALESGIGPDVREELARRGHILAAEDYFGGYQAILRDHERGVYHGGADMRKDGNALGF